MILFSPVSSSCHGSDNTPGESTGTPGEQTTTNLAVVTEPQIMAIATAYRDSKERFEFLEAGNTPGASLRGFFLLLLIQNSLQRLNNLFVLN